MIFAICYSAMGPPGAHKVTIGLEVARKVSEDEAIGYAMRQAKKFYKTELGYSDHEAIAIQIPDEWIKEEAND